MRRRGLAARTAAAAAVWLACAPPASGAECARAERVHVPGAERQKQACLNDLTTAGTRWSGHTDASDWLGLTPVAQRNPSGVPGLQVDGYFPDTSRTNGTHGWNHDAQFVIRLPDRWNGGLVITGAPGVRKQYSADPVIGDWVLSKGYAYASTDKGNTGTSFYADGDEPGAAVAEWHGRVTELARAAKEVVQRKYGRRPARTYVTGISNGGYLTRWQLENRPGLYDGGVDWEGTLMSPAGRNIFTYLPVALRNYPRYRLTGDRAAHEAMIDAGFSPGSEFLWDDHYAVYWDLTQRVYREEFDPDFDGDRSAGTPFCQSGTPDCDADYRYEERPRSVHQAVARVRNTGAIGRPMLTLHGTIDALLPIATDSDVYRRMVVRQNRGGLHRYYVIENGTHVDGRHDAFPSKVRPIWPCWAEAFAALEAWVERGVRPPRNQFVPDRRDEDADVANECAIPRGRAVQAAGPLAGRQRQAQRAAPRRLDAEARRVDRRALRVSGRLLRRPAMPAAEVCGAGSVVVRAGDDRRVTGLREDCSFATTLRSARGSSVRVRWLGNRVLEPAATVLRVPAAG